ncbi:MAG: YHYH protein [Planctomycetota bacterium]
MPRFGRLTATLTAVYGLTIPALAHPAGDSGQHDENPEAAIHAHPSVTVNGSPHRVTITERDGYRFITANGIPNHEPGRFPTRGNPNPISAQEYEFRVPLRPEPATRVNRSRALFGVALNGVPFDPGTAEIWTPHGRTRGRDAPRDGWRYEALTGNINLGLDDHNAHVQPTGAYHYHALPVGLYETRVDKHVNEIPDAMVLLGYAADGYPIYGVYGHEDADDPTSPLVKLVPSYRVKKGSRPRKSDTSPGGRYDGTFVQDWEYVDGLGHLDEHNGRTGVTPEYPEGTYYYVISEAYPFVPRTFHGTPDRSFIKRGGPQRGNSNQRPPRR